jgi:acyl-CoA thioesterase-1
VRYFYFLLTLLVASGCKKSPEPVVERPKATAAPTAVVDSRPAIIAFGDSLSAGYGAEPGKSFPDFLQKEIDRAGFKYRVVNEGISGDTTSGGVERLDRVIGMKPAIVILELGGNDGLRGLPQSVTRANMEKMVEALRGAGITVVLAGMTLPPNYGEDYIRGFEKIYTGIAAKNKLTRIPFLLEGVATNPALMQRDGIHPTAEGNEKVAALVMKYLRPLLKGK